MEIMLVVISILLAYSIGSVSFAVIFTKFFSKKDVRSFGSGNAGTTNVLRVAGVLPGVLTFLCDVLKGFVATTAGRFIFDYLSNHYESQWFSPVYGMLLCGLFCMLGHVFPVWFGFKGGKAVAVAVGIFYVINWRAITVALIVFAVVLLISKIVSVSSLCATVTQFVMMAVFPPSGNLWVILLLTFLMCTMVFVKHIDNIKRLLKDEEKKIFCKKEKSV